MGQTHTTRTVTGATETDDEATERMGSAVRQTTHADTANVSDMTATMDVPIVCPSDAHWATSDASNMTDMMPNASDGRRHDMPFSVMNKCHHCTAIIM